MRVPYHATLLALVLCVSATPALARGSGHSSYGSHSSFGRSSYSTGEHYTTSHVTKSGTYVAGHYSTNPNGTRNDNYSTRGNINPHTGVAGTKPRDGEN